MKRRTLLAGAIAAPFAKAAPIPLPEPTYEPAVGVGPVVWNYDRTKHLGDPYFGPGKITRIWHDGVLVWDEKRGMLG